MHSNSLRRKNTYSISCVRLLSWTEILSQLSRMRFISWADGTSPTQSEIAESYFITVSNHIRRPMTLRHVRGKDDIDIKSGLIWQTTTAFTQHTIMYLPLFTSLPALEALKPFRNCFCLFFNAMHSTTAVSLNNTKLLDSQHSSILKKTVDYTHCTTLTIRPFGYVSSPYKGIR